MSNEEIEGNVPVLEETPPDPPALLVEDRASVWCVYADSLSMFTTVSELEAANSAEVNDVFIYFFAELTPPAETDN